MKITIESTEMVTELDGVQVRLWEGTTEAGTPCKVFVHRVAVHKSQDSAEFDRELNETLQPPVKVDFRKII
jgi:hypothetical protein